MKTFLFFNSYAIDPTKKHPEFLTAGCLAEAITNQFIEMKNFIFLLW